MLNMTSRQMLMGLINDRDMLIDTQLSIYIVLIWWHWVNMLNEHIPLVHDLILNNGLWLVLLSS